MLKAIKTKDDCITLVARMLAGCYDVSYYGKAFTYDCYSGTYGYNCKTRIGYCNDKLYVYSWGQGWSDIQSTELSYPELLEIIWKDRKYINKALKLIKEEE